MAEEGTTGAEKKEITREQLLAYIKKAKVKIKDLEGEVTSVKKEYADLQARHATLEEQTAEASKKEVELNDRLVRAGGEAHRIESQGAARYKELQAKVKELEAALETSRRQQDDGRDLAEKAKRAESDLERAQKALEAERREAAKHREEAEMRIQALQEMVSQATLSSGSEGDSATVARLKQENEDVVAKLKQVVEKAKTWQQRAKSVAEQKTALETELREQTEKWTAETESLRAQVKAIECEGRGAPAGEETSTGVDADARDTLGEELEEAQRQLREATERHERQLQHATSIHQEELSRLQGSLTAAAEERQGLEAALKEKEVIVIELQRLVESLRSDAESRASEQQSSLHEKEQQIDELRRAVATAEEAAVAAAQRAQALESELSAGQGRLSQAKEEAERLKESLDERQGALAGKDRMISSLEQELEHLRQKVTEGEEAADGVRHRLDTAQREHAQAQARAQDMQAVHEQEKARLKSHVTEASEKSASAQRRVRELEAEVSRLSAALVETQREEQEEQTAEQGGGETKEQAPSVWSEGLLKELEQVKAERDGAQQEATTLRNRLEELQSELHTVQATAKATTEALDTLRGVTAAQDEEVDEIRVSRNRWKEEVNRLNARVKEADGELGRLRDATTKDEQSQRRAGELEGTVEELQAEVSRLKELLGEAVKAKAGAEEELAAGQAEVGELKSQLAVVVSWREEAEAGRQAEVQVRRELQGEVQRVQQELADAVEDRQRVERDLASSQARIAWLEGEVEALQRGQTHVDDLGRRLEELQTDRQEAVDAVSAKCESTVKSLQDALQESETARGEAEEALAAARSQAQTLKAELASVHERAQRVDDAGRSVEALEKALKEQQAELGSRDEELAVLLQAKTDADNARTAAEAEVKRVQEQLTAVQSNSHDVAAATELAQRLEQELADRRAELSRLGAKVEELSADKDAAQEGVAKVQKENEEILTQLNKLRAEKDSLQKDREVLQEELARARAETAAAEVQAAELLAQKKEQEESVKRLKVLLSKTRSAMQAKEAELSKTRAAPQPPSAFDVTMRVRDQAGEVWCRIEVSDSGISEEKAATTPWVTEAIAKAWLSSSSAAATTSEASDTSDAPSSSSSVEAWPAILQDEWECAAKEAQSREKALGEHMKELEEKVKSGEADFERYRMRAHSALKRFTERNGEEQRRDRLLEDENARLIKEKGDAEDAVKEAKGRVEELEKELERLKSEYNNLQSQLEGVDRDLEQSKLSSAEVLAGSAVEVERLRAELVEASKRLSASEAENDALEERIAELEGQVVLSRTHEEGTARNEGNKSDTTVTDKAGNSPPLAEAGNGQTVMEAGEGTAGGGGLMVGLPGAEDRDCVRRMNRKINTDQGVTVPPLDLGFSPMPPSPLSSRVGSEEFGGLSEQYVVVKQLTSEFQAQRARDLTLIAELQDEVQDCQVTISRLQEQEKSLKAALRDVEDSLARERELHADSINADYLKQAVLGYITAANEAERLTLLSVVTTMLHFTQEETSRARSMHERGGVRGRSRGHQGRGCVAAPAAQATAVGDMPSGYTAPPFVPSHVVILSDLPAREKEEWYKFLLEENVAFSRVERPDGTDGPRYVASVRVVAPNVPKDKALPPGLRPKKVWTSPNRERSYQERKPEGQTSPRSALVRPPLPDVMEFGPATVDLREYNCFISLLMETGPELARLRPVTWLMRTIEDVYDARYVHDTTDLQKEMDPVEERMHERVTRSFPAFVFEHLSKKYGLRALVEQNAWEVVLNTAVYRKENLAVEIFARFLDEMYDADDLLFFLYVRSVVQKSLNFSFRSRWVDKTVSTVKPQDLWLSHRECTHVCRTVFGNEQDPLCREFLQIVESQLVGKKRAGPNGQDARRIEVHHFLLLAVSGYHNTRPDDEGADAVTELNGVPLTPGRSQTSDQRRLYVDGLGSHAGDADRLDSDQHLRRSSHDAANDMSSFDSTRLDEYLKAIARDRIAMDEMERSVGALKMNNPRPPPVVVRPPAPQHVLDEEDAAIALAQMQLGMEARVVEHLMGTAAEELPFDIVSEIRSQVSSQLHEKVSRKLEGRLETGGPMGPEAAQEFLQETLSEPALLGDMETLVSLLVSYAQGDDNGGAPRRS